MNCKHVQELLPLYVGRDLEEKRGRLVTAHVQSCAACAGAADEYRESRQLLQQFAPPPFSDAVYDGIRQCVLREIEGESPESIGSALPNFVASLFRPRLRWAFATALLLAVSVFAFYFIANQRINRRQLQGGEMAASPSPSSKENGPSSMSSGRNAGADGTIAKSAGTHQSQRRKSLVAAFVRPAPNGANVPANVAVKKPDTRSIAAEASAGGTNRNEPNAIPADDAATSEKTLRVEMQTKDPNIRIIWFSPQPTKQDPPGKSSKRIQEARSYA